VAGSEWAEDVFVSPPMLNKIADWIVSTQRDDGAFPEVSTLIYSRNFLVSCFFFYFAFILLFFFCFLTLNLGKKKKKNFVLLLLTANVY
jgi:hypothetical protein